MAMRYIFLILVLFSFKGFGQAAQNLIPNGSFEQHYNCNYSSDQWFLPIDSVLYNWIDPMQASTDYFILCNNDSSYRAPLNAIGYQNAKDGEAYIGIVTYSSVLPAQNPYREYIQSKLNKPLHVGKKYIFKMYANLYDSFVVGSIGYSIRLASNNLGAYFTSWSYLHNASNLNFPAKTQINFNSIIKDTSMWIELEQSFVADSAYEYLTIGNFYTDSLTLIDTVGIKYPIGTFFHSVAYYFIDDVSLVEDTSSMVNNVENGASRLNVYPNPALNQLTVSNYNYSINTIEVTNVLGQQQNVSVEKLTTENCLLKTANLPSGIYFIKATDTKGNIMNGKFVKE